MIRWVLKIGAVLLLLGFIGLTGYAYLADFAPDQNNVTKPVVLDGE
jgi:hypothetical protein